MAYLRPSKSRWRLCIVTFIFDARRLHAVVYMPVAFLRRAAALSRRESKLTPELLRAQCRAE